MKTYIFGARATAAGIYKGLSVINPDKKVDAFIVSDPEQNVREIWGCPVLGIEHVTKVLSPAEIAEAEVFVAVPELVHAEIHALLDKHGFKNLIMIDCQTEAEMMERYFTSEGSFCSVHSLKLKHVETTVPKLTVYAASFYKDKPLQNPPQMPEYVKKIYLGCNGAIRAGIDISGQADFYDNVGDNTSDKNPNRCEMTAHYWVWKNRMDVEDEYVGICHYRRTLDLTEEDLKKMKDNDVDVVLPYPMLHYPNAGIQHTWYVPDKDWQVLKNAVTQLYPEYAAKFEDVFNAHEFYNYNMLLAKKKVFADYCAWLYPILDLIEETSSPLGADRHDRYTAYMSESLETLYFMANLQKLKICHTGRLLYT